MKTFNTTSTHFSAMQSHNLFSDHSKSQWCTMSTFILRSKIPVAQGYVTPESHLFFFHCFMSVLCYKMSIMSEKVLSKVTEYDTICFGSIYIITFHSIITYESKHSTKGLIFSINFVSLYLFSNLFMTEKMNKNILCKQDCTNQS